MLANALQVEPATATTSPDLQPQVEPEKGHRRQKALRKIRDALKYVGYMIRRAASECRAWAKRNPKIVLVVGVVVIGGVVILAFPEVAGPPVLAAIGFTSVRAMITGSLAMAVQAGITAAFTPSMARPLATHTKNAADTVVAAASEGLHHAAQLNPKKIADAASEGLAFAALHTKNAADAAVADIHAHAARSPRTTADTAVAAGVAGGGLVVMAVFGVLTSLVLKALGFSSTGPVAGSIAAWIQSWIGNVVGGSLFATLQSAAMGGYGVAVVAAVVEWVGAVAMAIVAAVVGWLSAWGGWGWGDES
ncbi:hypothetical protein QBC39DRAFT_375732 [Podospora conica]|nr:hypothetical protein QBC39DRAFT_375732 [Schizothecium conicum]